MGQRCGRVLFQPPQGTTHRRHNLSKCRFAQAGLVCLHRLLLCSPLASSYCNTCCRRCGRCLHVDSKWENDVLMVNRQAQPLWRDAVPPRDTVLPVPAGVPHRGKGRTVSLGGRFSTMLRSSRGVAKDCKMDYSPMTVLMIIFA